MRIGKILLMLCLAAGFLFADIQTDNTITFQGYLTDSSSKPFMGEVQMSFEFYSSEKGTDKLFELFNNARNVTVFNGNYTTKIEFTDPEITTMNNNPDIWVEVYVATKNTENNYDPNPSKLNTRIQLSAVPYALSVKGLYYDSEKKVVVHRGNISDKEFVATNTAEDGLIIAGKVGIGTANIGNDYQLVIASSAYISGDVSVNGRVSAAAVFGVVWN